VGNTNRRNLGNLRLPPSDTALSTNNGFNSAYSEWIKEKKCGDQEMIFRFSEALNKPDNTVILNNWPEKLLGDLEKRMKEFVLKKLQQASPDHWLDKIPNDTRSYICNKQNVSDDESAISAIQKFLSFFGVGKTIMNNWTIFKSNFKMKPQRELKYGFNLLNRRRHAPAHGDPITQEQRTEIRKWIIYLNTCISQQSDADCNTW